MSNKISRTLALHTIGCRLNQYETERMATALTPYGFKRAIDGEKADLYIINTCTVTHRADSDARAYIRRIARQNPNGSIVVTGCYVDNDPELIAGMEGVDVIVRNDEKDSISSILSNRLPELFDHEPDKGCSTLISEFSNRNRAWVKVSDGCNQWCSFCIIPTVRGRLRNRPVNDIIAEINQLVENGYREVVLTGVHLGHYKNRKVEPQVKNLAHLCRLIISETDLYRLRLSSIEPQTVREELVETYANSNGRICRHFHIPLQSGSSRILQLMQRPYDQKTYIKRVTAVKEAVPETIIGADVIVGFPGETDDDFQRTKALVESGLIDYLHVFSYSDRSGTPATEMPDKVAPEVIKERAAILKRISNKMRAGAHDRQVGQTLEVISERKEGQDGDYEGVADNYVRVKLPGWLDGGQEIVRVKITQSQGEYVEGEVLGRAQAS